MKYIDLTIPAGRGAVALGCLLTLGACPMGNPEFHESEGAATASSQTSDPGSAASTSSGASGSAGESASGVTSEPTTAASAPTSGDSTDSTGADASTTAPATTTDATDSGGSTDSGDTTGVGGCDQPSTAMISAVSDAFFISGGTDGGVTCNYYDALDGAASPCKKLNFGATPALRLARLDGGIDAMYAVRFSHEEIAAISTPDLKVLDAQLALTLYGAIFDDNQVLRVGKVSEEWLGGTKNGTPAMPGDSAWVTRNGDPNAPWTGSDGPRGASVEAASLTIPLGYPEHAQVLSTPFEIAEWIEDPMANYGLVVSFEKNVPLMTYGPGIKALESGEFAPVLLVRYCQP